MTKNSDEPGNLGSNVEVETDVEIGRGVVFSDTLGKKIILRSKSQIGAGAVISAGVEIGMGARVCDGAVVVNSVPANAIVQGNPAQIVGYTTSLPHEDHLVHAGARMDDGSRFVSSHKTLSVSGAALYQMPLVLEPRGNLTFGEIERDLPFDPRRYFVVFEVPSEKLRGEHAHKECHQFLVALNGSCRALLDDGQSREVVLLDRPDVGLYIPPMVWGTQYAYTSDAVLLVFASHEYEADDYIRDYESFLKFRTTSAV